MKTILSLFLFLNALTLSAQSLSEQMGGVNSTFELYSGDSTLELFSQVLIQRAIAKQQVRQDENHSYGLGLGYVSWHLEFVSKTKIGSRPRSREERSKNYRYAIEFINRTGDKLLSTYLTLDRMRMWEGTVTNEPIYTYSLDLITLPLLILDNTKSVNIVYLD